MRRVVPIVVGGLSVGLPAVGAILNWPYALSGHVFNEVVLVACATVTAVNICLLVVTWRLSR